MLSLSSDKEVCTRMIQSNLHLDILSNLQQCETETLQDMSSVAHRQFIETQLRTLYNVVSCSDAAAHTSSRQCLDVVKKFCKLTSHPVRLSDFLSPVVNGCHIVLTCVQYYQLLGLLALLKLLLLNSSQRFALKFPCSAVLWDFRHG